MTGEQVPGSQQHVHDLVKDEVGTQDVSPGDLSQSANLIHNVSMGDLMAHNKYDRGNTGRQENRNGTLMPEETEKSKDKCCKFSFEGFMDHIEIDEKENVVPTISVGGKENTITWVPTTPVVVG